jgi:type VI secretion system secreted protein VgrG
MSTNTIELAKFSVLASQTVTSTGATVVAKDVGVHPGSAITGFPPGIKHSLQGNAGIAMAELKELFSQLSLLPTSKDHLTEKNLGGVTLPPGVYKFDSSAELTGTLTLDGTSNPKGLFVFVTGSTLKTASNATVVLKNGAIPENVSWVVGSSATLGTNTKFVGNIMAKISATLTTGTDLVGSVWAIDGAVTLDSNVVG